MPNAKCRAKRRVQLSQIGKGCDLPLEFILHHVIDGEGKLMQIGAGAGLGEGNQASEDVTPNEATSIILHAVELFTSAATGFACVDRGGGSDAILDSECSSSRMDCLH